MAQVDRAHTHNLSRVQQPSSSSSASLQCIRVYVARNRMRELPSTSWGRRKKLEPPGWQNSHAVTASGDDAEQTAHTLTHSRTHSRTRTVHPGRTHTYTQLVVAAPGGCWRRRREGGGEERVETVTKPRLGYEIAVVVAMTGRWNTSAEEWYYRRGRGGGIRR